MYVEKLKDYLAQNQISIKDLCKAIKMSEGGFHQAVKANSFKVQTMEKISGYLGVPMAYWFTNERDPEIKGDNLLLMREVKYLTEKIVDQKEKIELLRKLLQDKEEMIDTLRKS